MWRPHRSGGRPPARSVGCGPSSPVRAPRWSAYRSAVTCAPTPRSVVIPISWFARAGLIANPSMFVLGKPGLGKSSLIRRMAIGLCGFGVQPLIFGDLKPDYVDLIGALGGNVVALGRGQGALNVLDPGAATAAALRLTGAARRKADPGRTGPPTHHGGRPGRAEPTVPGHRRRRGDHRQPPSVCSTTTIDRERRPWWS